MAPTSLLLLTALLILPGWATVRLCNIKDNQILLSISLSFSWVCLTIAAANYFQVSPNTLVILVAGLLLVSTAYLLRQHKSLFANTENEHLIALGAIVLFSFLYNTIVGPYTEIPADIYAHLERVQKALELQSNASFGHAKSLSQLLQQYGYIWYHLLALIVQLTNISVTELIHSTVFFTNSLFLIAVYCFSCTLFRNSPSKTAISLTAVAFVFLHMGINVFSFVRYYALAPVSLNFILYLTATSLIWQLLTRNDLQKRLASTLLIVPIALAAATVHTQEVLFIASISGIMITLLFCHLVFEKLPFAKSIFPNQGLAALSKRTITLLFATVLIGFFASYIYAHLNLTRAANVQWRLWEFGSGAGLIPDITTLNLGYQFIRVVTLWGLFVYLLFFLHWRRYKNNLLLVAGMLTPLFTILNPFFVDLFLRLGNSTTLWRLCYLIPVHYVAADLFVLYFKRLRQHQIKTRVLTMSIIAVLILLLLPIKNTFNDLHYSRFPTLTTVPDEVGYAHLYDLIEYLDTLPSKTVLTDPVTGYVISAMTKQHSYRRKFHRDRYLNFTFDDYSNDPLKRHAGKLLLINQRSNAYSETGRLARHWSPELFQNLNAYYPAALLEHIQNSPNRFAPLWQSDRIAVYEIHLDRSPIQSR